MAETTGADGGSQTLSRGLTVLALIGESPTPLTVADLAPGSASTARWCTGWSARSKPTAS